MSTNTHAVMVSRLGFAATISTMMVLTYAFIFTIF